MMHAPRFFPVRHVGWFALAVISLVGLSMSACARSGLPDFAKLVDNVSPTVVNISTVSAARTGPQFGSLFDRFFGAPQRSEAPQSRSLGSGFIISEDGYILTNFHVVEGAQEIIVRLKDRQQLVAAVVGVDQRSDLAVLKVDATDLPTVKIGSTRDIRAGSWVLAIGSPFQFDHSVTAGIVSAKERSLPGEQYVPFLQTDVAINPGNSGGPLFNLDGEVIGVNSQIYSESGGYQGVSFAIPIDVAIDVATQLRETGIVVRGWLGVEVQEVDRNLARSFGMRRPEGALLSRIAPNSPAAEAGLQVGDVILSFDDRDVGKADALPHMVGRADPGDRVKLRVLRNGDRQTISARIGALETDERRLLPEQLPSRMPTANLGLRVMDLSDAQKQRVGVDSGILVTDVGPGAALRAGIRRGDVLVSVNQVEIESVAQFAELVQALSPSESVPVLVQRRGQPLFLALGGRS